MSTTKPLGLCWCGCGQRTTIAKQTVLSRNMVKGQPMRFVNFHYFKALSDRDRAAIVEKPHIDTSEIPYGFCQCGCGNQTRLAPKSDKYKGWIRGKPMRFFGRHKGVGPAWIVDKETGCWIWQRSTDGNYGTAWDGEKSVKAHRLVYEQYKGPIPEGKRLDHLCRTKLCVNPDHLEPVTQAVNCQRGDMAKLTQMQVDEIRQLRGSGLSGPVIAKRFNVSANCVYFIAKGKSWPIRP